MISCEICDRNFHSDEIEQCPNTNCHYEDLCPNCYEQHVTGCMLGIDDNY